MFSSLSSEDCILLLPLLTPLSQPPSRTILRPFPKHWFNSHITQSREAILIMPKFSIFSSSIALNPMSYWMSPCRHPNDTSKYPKLNSLPLRPIILQMDFSSCIFYFGLVFMFIWSPKIKSCNHCWLSFSFTEFLPLSPSRSLKLVDFQIILKYILFFTFTATCCVPIATL